MEHASPPRRRVAFLLFPTTMLLDLAGPLQAFREARGADGREAYGTLFLSRDGGGIVTDTGIVVETHALDAVDAADIDTLLVVGGHRAPEHARDARVLGWVRAAPSRVRRVGSICLASFILAESGLLDGRRATTHWRWCERFARAFPRIRVEPDAIFVRDGTVWTSAGVTAGIDLALAMIAEDLGHAKALDVGRLLVVAMKRAGGQSQFSVELERQAHDACGRFDALHDWMRGHLACDLSVSQLAERAGMSPRTFARHYRAATGRTPARAVTAMRLEAAAAMLEADTLSVKAVATHAGFGDDERLRRAFLQRFGVAPQHYRERLQAPPSG